MQLVCKGCGDAFTASRKSRKFCSKSCAASTNNLGVDRHNSPVLYCLACEKVLPKANKKYCTAVCQSRHQYTQYIDRWVQGLETGNMGKHGVYVSAHVRRWLHTQSYNKCSQCAWNEINPWTNKTPLQIHHIDGDWTRTTPDNVELLCPSCHSLTEHFGGGNRGRGRRQVLEGTR